MFEGVFSALESHVSCSCEAAQNYCPFETARDLQQDVRGPSSPIEKNQVECYRLDSLTLREHEEVYAILCCRHVATRSLHFDYVLPIEEKKQERN